MANYYAHCRTNYFKVKDPNAFSEALLDVPDIMFEESDGAFMIWGNNPDGAGWPTMIFNDETNDWDDFDLPLFVADYLADDSVAIFMEVGYEKIRYLVGYAIAVNSKGETRDVSIHDIYEKAVELTNNPDNITAAEY